MEKDKNTQKERRLALKEARERYREWLKMQILDDYLEGLGLPNNVEGIRVIQENF